jgi:homoserine dehydrogenase
VPAGEREIRLGLLGLGNIGGGLVTLIRENADRIARRTGLRPAVRFALVRDPSKPRPIDTEGIRLTDDPGELLDDPAIDLIVEVMGGYEPARTYMEKAIRSGKGVVTANKAVLARHGAVLSGLASEAGVPLRFEASVAGCIPIIRALSEFLVSDRIESICGILNGTTNYILSRMTREGMEYEKALAEAQRLGFAEPDPEFDVSGMDSGQKLVILASLTAGYALEEETVFVRGIERISGEDIRAASALGYGIKLLAGARFAPDGRVELGVHPTLIPADHPLARVEGEINAVWLRGRQVGEMMLYGKGAGPRPTATALLADTLAAFMEPPDARLPYPTEVLAREKLLSPHQARSRFYIRFSVVDRPSVLATITGILGGRGISIAQVRQDRTAAGEIVPVILATHDATDGIVRSAAVEIDGLEVVRKPTVLMRLDDLSMGV